MAGILAALFFLTSCNDGCKPKDIRCEGNIQQICDNDGDWEDVIDCSEGKSIPEEPKPDGGTDSGVEKAEFVCCDISPANNGAPGCDLKENCK